jgi:mono/diheme cytochrome c family protein
MPATGRVTALLAFSSLLAACANLPEPESAGARLYTDRCGGCHRLYLPGSLKYDMWKYQVERMQGELRRRGIPPLTAEESATLLDYLERHSG